MRTTWLEKALLLFIPLLVLLVAFVGVCFQAGTPWPWNSVVHEDGHRTLLQTIFYFEHATRELVLDASLALAVAGAVRYFYPLPRHADAALRRMRTRMATCSVLVLAVILVGTDWFDGGQAILDNLAQLHTREGAPLAWGAHWRYHLIERFADMALAFAAVGVLWMCGGRRDSGSAPPDVGLLIAAGLAFAAGTLVFHVTAEPFRDPTFLGHQLRELLTHGLVTVPLALYTCLVLARRYSMPLSAGSGSRATWPIYAAGGASVACGVYLLAASVLMKAQSYGQKTSLAELIFPHFFEHTLGYLFVSALAGFLYLLRLNGASRVDAGRS